MKKPIYLIALLAIFSVSCIDEPEFTENEEAYSQNEYASFDFKSTNTTDIVLRFNDMDGDPYSGVKIQIWKTENNEGTEVLYKAVTNSSGEIRANLELASYVDRVLIETNYIGIPNNVLVPVNNNTIELIFANGEIQSEVIDPYAESSSGSAAAPDFNYVSAVADGVVVNYLGDYTNYWGKPKYLEKDRDQISDELMDYINASLPEGQPVPEYHPTFLTNTKRSTLEVVELCDVWLTFVHEGAGFRNAIAFYTYPTGNPPQTEEEVGEITVIFPNLSYKWSGGQLQTGDKVNIGRFEPGTTIGLVIMSDGWNGRNSETPTWQFYGDKHLNSENDPDLQHHNVLLWDEENELFLIGFEDVKRTEGWCDNDFNDAILYMTSNPVEGLSTENVSPVDKPDVEDTDGDGINDPLDEYPNDPNKAYDSYYPSPTSYGSFAFEDNWPNYGDYDFNDMVVDYQFKHTYNSSNEVVAMDSKFIFRALGAGFRNGFGFATGLLPSDVASVNGYHVTNRDMQMNANGTEANQSNAVFIVTSNVHDHFDTFGFVNTKDEDPYFEPAELILNIEFNAPKSLEQIGAAPYNPFVIINQERGREVHLPGYYPTDLVDTSYFGAQDDDSDPSGGVYYKSKTALPWGIHLPESFTYPKEQSDIREGHLRFNDWARSSGFSYMDWYKSQTGYRNTAHLYTEGN